MELTILHNDQKKLMDTLEVQLGSIRDLHDAVKTLTRLSGGLSDRVADLEAKTSSHDRILEMMIDTSTNVNKSIAELKRLTKDRAAAREAYDWRSNLIEQMFAPGNTVTVTNDPAAATDGQP